MSNVMDEAEIYHNGRTYAGHCAWLDSLVGDEYRIAHMPIGHLFNLAMASNWKRALLTIEMTADDRLKILDGIAQCVFGPVSAAAVMAIEPIDDTGAEIISEICSLPVEKQTRAFGDGDVFRLLAKLNPSLLVALRLCDIGEIPAQPRISFIDTARMGAPA